MQKCMMGATYHFMTLVLQETRNPLLILSSAMRYVKVRTGKGARHCSADLLRARRRFEEGRTCHVCNRVGGGSMEFADEALACTHLECDREELGVRGRAPDAVRLRELIGLEVRYVTV